MQEKSTDVCGHVSSAVLQARRPAFLQHGARNVPANVSRFLLHTGRSVANLPATVHRIHQNHHSPQDSGGVSKHRLVPISPTFYITLPNDNCYVAADAVDRWDRQTDGRTDGRMQQRQLNESPTRYGKPVCSSVLAASFPRLILDVECTSASAAMFVIVDITGH